MWAFVILMFFIFLIIGITTGITPLFSRHATPFSVSLPIDYLQKQFVKIRKERYAFWNILMSILLGVPLFITPYIDTELNQELFISIYTGTGMILLVMFSFILYLKYRHDLLEWKKTIPKDAFEKAKKIVVDSEYHQKLNVRGNFSIFIWQLTIIAITVILTYAFYDQISKEIPIHWNSSMQVDRLIQKSPWSVLMLPAIQVLLIPVFNFSHYSFIQSKQKLSPLKPVVSGEKSRLFRKAWSNYLWMATILTQLLLSVVHLFSLFLNESPIWPIMVVLIVYLVIMMGSTIYLTVKYGQAGEKLKLDKDDEGKERYYEDSEEDKKWIGGLIYYNPEDSSIFVEKRFGIGSTINMARWQSWVIIAGLFGFMIVTVLLSFMME